MNYLTTLVRALEFALGTALICVGLFLSEDEEGRVQNQLENLWIKVDDRSKVGATQQFIRGCAQLYARALDRLFGRRLLSIQACGISLCLAEMSLLIPWLWGNRLTTERCLEFVALLATVLIAVLVNRPWVR